MKKTAYLLVVACLLCAAPAFAQGPFTDVPTDHWAYDAIDQLQKDGIVIGYPDGTFSGKRAITRYEFAVALARLPLGGTEAPKGFVTNEALQNAMKDYAKKSDIPDVSKFASKDDVAAIRRLVDEFRDEIAALGVDVDALTRDVAALACRVDAIENEMKRVRFTGEVNIYGIASSASEGDAVDINQNTVESGPGELNTMARTVQVFKDFDLKIDARVNDATTVKSLINYGDYLNSLVFVDDFTGSLISLGTAFKEAGAILPWVQKLTDRATAFTPYYTYVDTTLGKGKLTLGRFPLQFTNYTLKKLDVDYYTTNTKTDDGNYPVDGVKWDVKLAGIDWSWFAAKLDSVGVLINGLTGQPRAGLYLAYGPFNQAGGTAVGGVGFGSITTPLTFDGAVLGVTQAAGVRAQLGTPWKGNLGLTYYQAWSKQSWALDQNYDQGRVMGADITIPLGFANFCGSYTQSQALTTDGTLGVTDVDDDNAAWDAKFGFDLGRLGVNLGYKDIGPNFAAAGAWDRIGLWYNPTNIKGPYFDLNYPVSDKVKLGVCGEFLKLGQDITTTGLYPGTSDFATFAKDDKIDKIGAGIDWQLSACNSLGVSYEWVKMDLGDSRINGVTPFEEGKEQYLNVGIAHKMSPNASLKIGYQFIDYAGGPNAPYGEDYKGGKGVVQLGVSF